jgi:hypothetical protein
VDGAGGIAIENSSVTNCSAKHGGGIYVKGGVCQVCVHNNI